MLIEIHNEFADNGKEYFRFKLYDGPDGIEEVSGVAIDLPEAFAKIIEWRFRISQEYTEATEDETIGQRDCQDQGGLFLLGSINPGG
jgi:hypothetical protein